MCPLPTLPWLGSEWQGPTIRVGISERLEVVAEELLLLWSLGQGAAGEAGYLRSGWLFSDTWAVKGQAGERAGEKSSSDTESQQHGKSLTMEKLGLPVTAPGTRLHPSFWEVTPEQGSRVAGASALGTHVAESMGCPLSSQAWRLPGVGVVVVSK